jgi:hypothetical protein
MDILWVTAKYPPHTHSKMGNVFSTHTLPKQMGMDLDTDDG